MSAGASRAEDSDGRRPAPEQTPAAADASQRQTPERMQLEQVLRQMLDRVDGPDAPPAVELQALCEVARRHPGEPLTLEPVTVELVQALLGTHFQKQTASLNAWREATTQIARTLFDDPGTRRRLEKFWTRLSNGTS